MNNHLSGQTKIQYASNRKGLPSRHPAIPRTKEPL